MTLNEKIELLRKMAHNDMACAKACSNKYVQRELEHEASALWEAINLLSDDKYAEAIAKILNKYGE